VEYIRYSKTPWLSLYRKTNTTWTATEWLLKVQLSLCFIWTPRQEGVLGEWRSSSTHSLSSALDGRWVVTFMPRSLYPQRNSPWNPLDRRLGGPQSRSGHGEMDIIVRPKQVIYWPQGEDTFRGLACRKLQGRLRYVHIHKATLLIINNTNRIATRLRAGRPRFDSRQGLELRLFDTVSRPALGPNTNPPIQWTPGIFSRGWSDRCVKVTIHLHLVPRSKRGCILKFPDCPPGARTANGIALCH
jgi:hypothetical protein